MDGGQRAPYFEIQAERFALIAVDTGILRRIDAEQLRWLRHRLGAGAGQVQDGDPRSSALRGGRATRPQGDEPFCRDPPALARARGGRRDGRRHPRLRVLPRAYDQARRPTAPMHHFVNGGGGAYLSIGTALDWPKQAPVAGCAFYPRTDAVIAKLDAETPRWKSPMWWWVKRLGAWPSAPEALASAFDFNRAPVLPELRRGARRGFG